VEIRLTTSCDLPECPAARRQAGRGISCVAVRWLKVPFTFAFIRALLIRQSMGYVLTRETVMAGVSHRTFTTIFDMTEL
jgi:hypothetical protein